LPKENKMATELLFGIVMIVLAVLLFGSILLVRNRSARRMESPVGMGGFRFKDCYDLCLDDPNKDASDSCKAMCVSYGGA
jgi:hypothetical protein